MYKGVRTQATAVLPQGTATCWCSAQETPPLITTEISPELETEVCYLKRAWLKTVLAGATIWFQKAAEKILH